MKCRECDGVSARRGRHPYITVAEVTEGSSDSFHSQCTASMLPHLANHNFNYHMRDHKMISDRVSIVYINTE